MTERSRNSIIIVGGGASGVILAGHLLRSPDPNLRVTLVEKRASFGPGIAYSTSLPDHLLNVSAMGMSALADDPEHFWRWLRGKGLAKEEAFPVYAPRSVYGLYLQELLMEIAEREPGRLRLVQEEGVSVSPTPAGVELRLANGTSIVGHVAVLAAGHDEEPASEQGFAVRIGSAEDTQIDLDSRVLILGTGLSMVDAWLTLEHRGHRGEIVAVSRRGLLPSPHRKGSPIRLDSADILLGTELSYFVGWFRDLVRATEKAGGNWRDVVDGLRPFNQRIWQSWPVSAKRRFLKHTKAWWDIHRHRMAPEIHARISEAVRSGRLRLIAGRVLGAHREGRTLTANLQLRQSQAVENLEVGVAYDCTGIVKDVSTGAIAVVRSLTDRGLARPDPLRLSLDVTPDCAVIDADGSPSDKLFAVGPLTRGTFFEIDAIPDIRVQCARLAEQLAG
ncbi:FAD/NAD(P)-binding protein [Mesorhizobium sp. M0923]|uniref:FAD/NAD(P)-binding protein n=1 Tax=unclassified Mesorhizobium TaxID=325217 RepID=UPI0003D02FF3|nr:FAD/NAD(P)-binding protein [Mesorhizobium sp. L48C026A00]ESZ08490.1 FAD dependent oxidoreductase [Mesorhizobium sp. L48C026A00]